MAYKLQKISCIPFVLATLLLSASASVGQTYLLEAEGVLSETDPRLTDGSLYDEYFFDGEAGQIVRIVLKSSEFEAYLFLNNPSSLELAQKGEEPIDNGDGTYDFDLDARIVIRLPTTGRYKILANTRGEESRGQYQLSVTSDEDELYLITRRQEADESLAQGIDLKKTGESQKAIDALQSALAVYKEVNYKRGEANALGNLGEIFFSLHDYEKSAVFFEQSLAIEKALNNPYGAAISLGNLAHSYRLIGDHERAIELFNDGLKTDIIRNTDNRRKADLLYGLADSYYETAEYSLAVDFYKQNLGSNLSRNEKATGQWY